MNTDAVDSTSTRSMPVSEIQTSCTNQWPSTILIVGFLVSRFWRWHTAST